MPRLKTTPAPVADLPFPGDPIIQDVDATTDAPPTATVETTPAREPPQDDMFGQELAEQNLRERRALEDVFSFLAQGGELDAARLALLRRWGPRTDNWEGRKAYTKWLEKEVNRVKNVRELQAKAGSGDDRQQADAEATAAEDELSRQRPEIEAEIRALQARLSSLETTATRLRSASDARKAAVNELQQHRVLPTFIQDDLKLATDRANRDWRAELSKARSRASALRGVIAIDPDARENRDMLRLHIEAIPGSNSTGNLTRFYYTDSHRSAGGTHLELQKLRREVWDEYIDGLRRELATVDATIAKLEPMEAQAAAEVEKFKNYYVPQ